MRQVPSVQVCTEMCLCVWNSGYTHAEYLNEHELESQLGCFGCKMVTCFLSPPSPVTPVTCHHTSFCSSGSKCSNPLMTCRSLPWSTVVVRFGHRSVPGGQVFLLHCMYLCVCVFLLKSLLLISKVWEIS